MKPAAKSELWRRVSLWLPRESTADTLVCGLRPIVGHLSSKADRSTPPTKSSGLPLLRGSTLRARLPARR